MKGVRERIPSREQPLQPSPTFTAPPVRPQLIARLAGTLVTAQGVQTALLTASSVRLSTLIFLYNNGDSYRTTRVFCLYILGCRFFLKNLMLLMALSKTWTVHFSFLQQRNRSNVWIVR
jgi:hypothetical protein